MNFFSHPPNLLFLKILGFLMKIMEKNSSWLMKLFQLNNTSALLKMIYNLIYLHQLFSLLKTNVQIKTHLTSSRMNLKMVQSVARTCLNLLLSLLFLRTWMKVTWIASFSLIIKILFNLLQKSNKELLKEKVH